MEILRITPAAARVNARLTQDEAAKRLHITKATLIKWEKGITEPKIEQARAMSREYGIPIDNISFGS
jgi:DNA-binding XRE family transcriptional regulator